MNILDRDPYSDYGREFCSKIPDALGHERESKIVNEILLGNIPDFLRSFVPIEIKFGDKILTIQVMPDYLSVGHDTDYVRVPLNPKSAQTICDAFGCMLPTRKLVNIIWDAAAVKLTPQNMPPTSRMTTTDWFVKHDALIDVSLTKKKAVIGQLVAGHKKDVVVTKKIEGIKDKVAIYGWHQSDGKPIQGLNAGSHDAGYADYSHGIRLVSRFANLDGTEIDLRSLLLDPNMCSTISDEGILKQPFYITK
jgi:hypothetical protein